MISRIAFRSTSVTGLWSAVAAGLGVTPRIALDLPGSLHVDENKNLPPLGFVNLQLSTGEHLPRLGVEFARTLQSAIQKTFAGV